MQFARLLETLRAHRNITAVSFDVFDTVVFRRQGSWRDFLADLSRRLTALGLLDESVGPDQFIELRFQAESDAHRTPVSDGSRALHLGRIYEHFPIHYRGKSGLPKSLADAEFEFEAESVYVLPATIELLQRLDSSGRLVCFTSNTYYTRRQLGVILASAGVPEFLLQFIYCSCEYGKGKQHGLLADVLLDLQLAPQNLLHCGDNPGTDVKAARDLGIEASHYKGALDVWLGDVPKKGRHSIADALRTCSRFDPVSQPFQSFGYSFLGSHVAGFVAWLLDVSLAADRSRLLFAEREGIFLKAATDLALSLEETGSYSAVETDLLAVSREAVSPLVLGDEGSLDLQTDMFARRLRFGVSEVGPGVASEAADFARKYLNHKIGDFADSILVDIGYKGTINHVINASLGSPGSGSLLGAYFIHSAAASRPGSPGVGYLPEDDSSVEILPQTMKGIGFLEQCLMPPSGSVVGYDFEGAPVREEFLIGEEQIGQQASIQEGILLFIQDLQAVCRELSLNLADAVSSQSQAVAELLSMFRNPTRETSSLAAGWFHEVNFGTRQLVPVSAEAQSVVVGPAVDMIQNGRSWVAPLRRRGIPVSGGDGATASSNVSVLGATSRGPIGPGLVTDTHPVGSPKIACMVQSPEGEVLKSLRLSGLDFGVRTARVRMYGSFARGEAKGPTLYENLLADPCLVQAELIWQRGQSAIVSDPSGLARSSSDEGGDVVVTFSDSLESRALIVVIEPDSVLG